MATRTPPKASDFKREPYKQKELSRITSTAPDWAWGCELCRFGLVNGEPGHFCTCRAGQGRARFAAGIVLDDAADDVRVPTFNAAYGGNV